MFQNYFNNLIQYVCIGMTISLGIIIITISLNSSNLIDELFTKLNYQKKTLELKVDELELKNKSLIDYIKGINNNCEEHLIKIEELLSTIDGLNYNLNHLEIDKNYYNNLINENNMLLKENQKLNMRCDMLELSVDRYQEKVASMKGYTKNNFGEYTLKSNNN